VNTYIHVNGGRDNNIHDNYISASDYAIWIPDRSLYNNWAILDARLAASPYKTPLWINQYPQLAAPMNNSKWPEGNKIENNVIVSTNSKSGTQIALYSVPTASTTIDSNIVWSKSGSPTVRSLFLGGLQKAYVVSKWADWMKLNVEKNSLYADPCITINNKQLVSCPTSPINRIGFAIMPSDIGLIK